MLRFGSHSRATVVLNHTGHAAMAQVVEVVVGDGAQASVVSLQDWDDDAVHLDAPRRRWSVATRRTSTSRSASAATSCGWTPTCRTPVPAAPPSCSASTSPTPASTSSTGSSPTTTRPRTKSNVLYKGALQGQGAHTVWVGNVLIRKVAEGIETYEENRNLVLSDGCQADSVPNLEIETGEIERGRARAAPPPASTTSSCSTCARAASTTRRPAASSCTASSTT